ncbi:hypothetical protein X802_09250 [Thermococcus guaymasensis DSM 11113]|uniref:Cas12f1-like TNB domain-containing protein n=1 Tax=Thermococcus guaymasensis DSM 11113 TaxID=1432656 RepID=A0A0X1KNJ7_9EURY|nr:hypothetical protein X802_09250 [Thermococcus guaymasensis DSM 11113]
MLYLEMKRTVTIKLQPSKEQEKIPHQLVDTRAKAWNKQNFILSHVWRFNTVIKRLTEVVGEYGIRVLIVGEVFTSKVCPVCGKPHEGLASLGVYLSVPQRGLP